MNKKIIAMVLAAVMVMSMTACSGGAEETATAAEETTTAEESVDLADETTVTVETNAAGILEEYNVKALMAIAEEGMQTTIECDPMVLSLACSGTIEGTVQGDSVDAAIAAVSDWTNGNVVINFYPSGQLGGDAVLIEGARMGTIDMFMGAPTSQVTLIPELAVVDIGGLFETAESCNIVLTSFKEMIQPYYQESGLRLLTMFTTNFRILSSNKPVAGAADLQGLNIRIQDNKYHKAFWSALGTNPIPMAFGELYIALQQGMLDAQENPYASIVGPRLCEVQDYIVETNHIPFINTVIMSNTKYESMSENQQLVVDQFVEYLKKFQAAGTATDDAALADVCRDEYGIQITTTVPADIKALFGDAAQVVVDMMKEDIDPEFVDEYMALVEANK